MSLFSPGNVYVICSVPLDTICLHPRCTTFTFVLEQSSDCDHNAIIYTKSFICGIKNRVSFFTHNIHHFLQSLIAAYAAYDQHLVRSNMCHCTLYKHRQIKTKKKSHVNTDLSIRLPVISISIANTVSCKEKHKSSRVNVFVSSHLERCSSIWLKIPENDTSIPFTTYGNGANFLPLLISRKY